MIIEILLIIGVICLIIAIFIQENRINKLVIKNHNLSRVSLESLNLGIDMFKENIKENNKLKTTISEMTQKKRRKR